MKKVICFFIVLFISLGTLHSQSLFLKEKGGKYGYVDASGIVKIPIQYNFAFTDTLNTIAFVTDKGNIKAINKANQPLFTVFNYDNGPDYVSEGLFRIIDDQTGLIGFANLNGNIIIQPVHSFVAPFNNGLALFNKGGKTKISDPVNQYTSIEGGKWGYINKEGDELFPAIFDQASSFEDKQAKVKIGHYEFQITYDSQ